MIDINGVWNRIDRLRKRKGLSLMDLQNHLTKNGNYIYTARSKGCLPSIDNLCKIADILDCSVDYLLGREQPKMKNNEVDLYEVEKIVIRALRNLD